MSRKRKWAVADCETDPFLSGRIPQPFIWGFYDGESFEMFESTERFTLFAKEFEGTIYAHNGGRFDWHYLVPYFESGQRIMLINGRISKARLGKAELRDSFNLLQTPLSAFKKSNFEYWKLESENRRRYWKEIIAYLEADCVDLYEYLRRYFERYPSTLTMAGAAMRLWQSDFGGLAPKSTPAFYELMKPFYFGGRCQAFNSGIFNGRFENVDINSAYPYAMRHAHPFDTKPREIYHAPKDSELSKSFLEITAQSSGCLPVRSDSGAIDYPHGMHHFSCSGHEFIAGIETGALKNVHIRRALVFNLTIDFEEYVNHFYTLKAKAKIAGDRAEYNFSKLFLNSLYGKFAANPERYREYVIGEFGERIEGYTADAIVGNRQLFSRPAPVSQMRYFNLATAASITGFVRAFLWRAIASQKSVLYCDTDSLLVRGTAQVPYGDSTGQWSLENKADEAAIAARKLYALFWHGDCIKARSKGARLNGTQIKRIANGEEILYTPSVPTFSLKTGIGFTERRIRRVER